MDWFLYDNGLRHERVKVFDVTLLMLFAVCTLCLLDPKQGFTRNFIRFTVRNMRTETEDMKPYIICL